MFNLDGKKSHECELASRIILSSSLYRERKSQIAVTIYRQIPEDSYWFITTMVGVRQPEPMYGPKTLRRGHLYDFGYREKIKQHVIYHNARPEHELSYEHGPEKYRVHLSLRGNNRKDNKEIISTFESELLPPLRELLRHSIQSQPGGFAPPLYPDIWNIERRARDAFRQASRNLPPLASPSDVLKMISNVLVDTLKKTLANGNAQSEVEVIMYLPTLNSLTRKWSESPAHLLQDFFPESIPLPPFPPRASTKENEDRENVVTWSFHAARPLFFSRASNGNNANIVSNPLSDFWKHMVARPLPGMAPGKLLEMVESPSFQGLSVVPIPDLTETFRSDEIDQADPVKSMGILLVHCKHPTGLNYFPAQHFLVCRLARVIAGYLTPLLPLPGFPRWSEHMWRGGAEIVNPQNLPQGPNDAHGVSGPLIAKFIQALMPTGSKVKVEPSAPGSTAAVYKLHIKDKNEISESSRIIKIGKAAKILKERENYFRFIHNKHLGLLARIDVSQAFSNAESVGINETYGAVVYHFVENATTVEDFIKQARFQRTVVEDTLGRIVTHMEEWWGSTGPRRVNAKDLFLTKPFCSDPPWSKWNCANLSPTHRKRLEQLHEQLLELNSLDCGPVEISPTLMHGDLHFRNIFTLNGDTRTTEFALIDWGEVTDGGHSSLDFAHMLVDTCYRVCWKKPGFSIQWMKHLLEDEFLAPDIDCIKSQRPKIPTCRKLALLHKMVKYYVMHLHVSNPTAAFITDDAAEQLHTDIKHLMTEIRHSVDRRAHRTTRPQPERRARSQKSSFQKQEKQLLKRIRECVEQTRSQMLPHLGRIRIASLSDHRIVIRFSKRDDPKDRAYFRESIEPTIREILTQEGFKEIIILAR